MSTTYKPCANCHHAFSEHAPDRNHPNTSPCWHLAGTGEGCTSKYDERCKNYVDPDSLRSSVYESQTE